MRGAGPYPTVPDLAVAADLTGAEHGRELLATLREYVRAGTLRSTAESMYLHHSTVSHRLGRLSEHLKFDVVATQNRARATALMLALDAGS
ncbi:helix-turn-helix domain-containing protein [Gordonia terrae]